MIKFNNQNIIQSQSITISSLSSMLANYFMRSKAWAYVALPHDISNCQIQYWEQQCLDNVVAEFKLLCGKSCIPLPIPA